MSLFDEEIRDLEQYEKTVYDDSLASLKSAVTGKFHRLKMEDSSERIYHVLEEILAFYKIKMEWVAKRNLEFEEQLTFLLKPYGMMWRFVASDSEWYKEDHGPMVATLADGRIVAVLPRRGRYVYKDPDTGAVIFVRKENASCFTGNLYEVFLGLPSRKLKFADVLRFIFASLRVRSIVQIFLFTDFFIMLGSAFPELTSFLLDNVEPGGEQGIIFAVLLVYFLVAIVRFLFGWFRDEILHKSVTSISKNFQIAVMMRLYYIPVSELSNNPVGELGNHVMKTEELMYTILSGGVTFILSAVFSLSYLISIRNISEKLYKGLNGFIFWIVFVFLIAAAVQYFVSRDALRYKAEEDSLSLSLLRGMQKITLTGSGKRAFVRWSESYKRSAVNRYRPPIFLRLAQPIATAVIALATYSIYLLVSDQHIPATDFYRVYSLFGLIAGFLTEAGVQAISMASALPVFELLKPVFKTETENTGERITIEKTNGYVSVKGVGFKYTEDGKKVLDGLSFDVERGEYVALVGKSGCGKSTVIRILLGFEEPLSGDVFYNGQPLHSLDLRSVRKNIGTVLQGGTVIRGTIEENIKLNNARLTEEEVWEAVKIAGLEDDIIALPLGLKTPLPYGGTGMSGGQIQKIMIARAVANHPSILIFDEATSALDNISQMHITEALDHLDCTRIVVAHRLSTIENCDRILVMEDGKIVEEGDYHTLMSKNGFFTELVKRQKLEDVTG